MVVLWGGFLGLQLGKGRLQRCSGPYYALFACQVPPGPRPFPRSCTSLPVHGMAGGRRFQRPPYRFAAARDGRSLGPRDANPPGDVGRTCS